MIKKLFIFIIALLLVVTFVSASERIVNIPDYIGSFDEWKVSVLQANGGEGYFATSTGDYWGFCERTCAEFDWNGDCSPCASGEVANMCTWHPDSMSVVDTWSSASSYCSDWLKPYDYYNRQCYCKVPTPECSGGGDPGDRKCEGSEIWECSDSGVWEYVSLCPYGCSSGSCQQQQCTDHASKQCSGGSVYWYDSCGEKQEEYERCESDEVCQDSKCVRVCNEGFIGSALCSGDQIVQQYQLQDCSTEIRSVEVCTYGCKNSQCIEPQCPACPNPTSWSQCSNGEMFRTNYECDIDTNYQCSSFTETENCECGTSVQCQYDEVCDLNVCIKLECSEEEIADNHECIKKSSLSNNAIILIASGIAFVVIILLIIVVIKLKGGKTKEDGGNKKRV